MSGFWRFIKRCLLGVALLWMAVSVEASDPVERVAQHLALKGNDQVVAETVALREEIAGLRRQNRLLSTRLESMQPEEAYIVIDTNGGRLFLKDRNETLLDAVCSTGKGDTLTDGKGRVWVFKTPLGLRTVKLKKTDPKWTKPDWAFIEENEPIPKDRSKRVEEDVLGDYALEIGDDYMIHGTLYTRLLGRPVTHGCIRLGDEDLKKVYETAQKGTRVYLF